MRVEINHGIGEKSEVIATGDERFIDLNKIFDEFLKSDIGYRIEVYRWNISARTVKRKYRKRFMTDMTRIV